ncbi:hypothetical protein LO762_29620 [Actinocorallia sp. API 0066]|uniref:hypothetical protein n=1 Tax=Actinocorallia sp. API 0066 TaxID=2896846 RepID=UPI001E584B20|nr:hypothetical protein [Actinocorallia sp. API 0066]MCD0453310.1 hypothetical protein [Actinocorallia sp. API 0066]
MHLRTALAAVLVAVSLGTVPAVPAAAAPAESVTTGDFFRIYDPSVGETRPWYINDHTFIRDEATGTWHLFGITHPEPASPEDEDQFAHATAPSLRGPWTKRPMALTVDPSYGESHLWAPHVIRSGSTYYMFYAGGQTVGDASRSQINLATSTDLYHWTRRAAGPLFRDGWEARDPMVARIGSQWVMYYTATERANGGRDVVAYRTSTDLVTWSARKIAYTAVGDGWTESPYVMQRNGLWHLFLGGSSSTADYVGAEVYASTDPFRFTQSGQVGRLPSHAAEVVADTDGSLWLSSAGWGAGGVDLARLSWRARPYTPHRVYGLSPDRSAVYQRTSGSSWIRIGGAAGTLIGGDGNLFATNPTTGDLYKYNGTPENWSKVGGPGAQFVVAGGRLYGLRPDRSAVYQWTGSGTTWTKVGGPAGRLYGGPAGLFATNPTSGDLYRYSGTPENWTKIGGPGAQFAVTVDRVYGLSPDRSAVFQWTGSGTTWTRVGGAAGALYGGGAGLFATNPLTGDLYKFSGVPQSWSKVGGPGAQFAVTGDRIYGLSPDRSGVYQWSGLSLGWARIGGPAASITTD